MRMAGPVGLAVRLYCFALGGAVGPCPVENQEDGSFLCFRAAFKLGRHVFFAPAQKRKVVNTGSHSGFVVYLVISKFPFFPEYKKHVLRTGTPDRFLARFV